MQQPSNPDQPRLPDESSRPGGIERAAVTVRTAVIELLDAFGMQTIFGNPGSTELPMFSISSIKSSNAQKQKFE